MCDKLLFAFIMVRRVQARATATARAKVVDVVASARAGACAGAVPEQSRAEQRRRGPRRWAAEDALRLRTTVANIEQDF